MLFFPALAAVIASTGWALAIVIAQAPARALAAFAFTRLQLLACATALAVIVSVQGNWTPIIWSYWPALMVSSVIGVILGNLAMIGCLRRGGPRRTELLLCFKAPIVGVLAYLWLGETITFLDLSGAALTLIGVSIAIGNSDAPLASDTLDGPLWP